MHYCLTNAVIVFIDMMNKIFKLSFDKFMMIFIDVILVHWRGREEYEEQLIVL